MSKRSLCSLSLLVLLASSLLTKASTSAEALWSPQELAAFLGLPLSTIRDWRRRGVGPPATRLYRHVRYQPADVAGWLEEMAEAQGQVAADPRAGRS